jgi:cell division protein YceG involved in septum cleavage
MSAIEMDKELERIGALRRSLEPLAVLYEKAVLEAGKEPFEVRLTTQQSTDHLSENYHGADTFHIIDGESLQAVHEIWQEYRRIELQLLEQSEESLPDSLAYLSAAEQEWLEWFYHLSDEDQKMVEEYGEIDISVASDNFDQVKKVAADKEARDLNSIIQLFKD